MTTAYIAIVCGIACCILCSISAAINIIEYRRRKEKYTPIDYGDIVRPPKWTLGERNDTEQ